MCVTVITWKLLFEPGALDSKSSGLSVGSAPRKNSTVFVVGCRQVREKQKSGGLRFPPPGVCSSSLYLLTPMVSFRNH